MTVLTSEDAIRGLMLLGRTREQAEREFRECEDQRIEQMRHAWFPAYNTKER